MKRIEQHAQQCFHTYRWAFPIVFWLLFCAGIGAGRPAWALDDGSADVANASSSGTVDQSGGAAEGPVRLARFSYVSGDVTWRGDAQADWSAATLNLPLRQGAQIWVPDASRAEVQFDDGSHLRLDSGTLITLQTLYSDADGEFTELTLNEGLTALRLREDHSTYQINTPLVSIKATGPAMMRIGASDGAQIGVQDGSATVEGPQGKTTLRAGVYLDLADNQAPYDVRGLPRPDSWDDWNTERDRELDAAAQRPAHRYLPPDIALVADGLDDYGTWHSDPTYGEVWCPRPTSADWRPYKDGQWTWVAPFGWTWVSDEPWGWAPYHYGTWIHEPYGWAWAPGPAVQYWSPAGVEFYQSDGNVAWCPLAPDEIRYPDTLAIDYHQGDWSLSFSIGQAAVYYPTPDDNCEARAWSSEYVNSAPDVVNIESTTIVDPVIVNHNTPLPNIGRIPLNARVGGATMADAQAFGGHGAYRPVPNAAASIFVRGRPIAAPAPGRIPIAGPAIVRPATPAWTAQRQIPVPPTILNRPVYRVPVQPAIARTSTPMVAPVTTGRTPIARTMTPNSNGDGTVMGHGSPTPRVVAPRVIQPTADPVRHDNPAPAPVRVVEPARPNDPTTAPVRTVAPVRHNDPPAQPVRVVEPVRRDSPPAPPVRVVEPVRTYTPPPPPPAPPVRTYAPPPPPPPPPAPTRTESGGSSQGGHTDDKKKGGKP
jgi:hypothetical protein